MEHSNHGLRVLVTGGSRGIGSAIVRCLADAGYDVQFIYNKSVEPAEALLKELRAGYSGQTFSAHQVDLGARAAVDAFADFLSEESALYAYVHNAGQSYDTLAALADQSRTEAIMQVNFLSLTKLVTAVLRPMMRAKSGRVVNIGSITALRGTPGNSIYAATKGAAQSYMSTLAVEIAPKGITANTIAPGYVDTDLLKLYSDHRATMEKQIPAGRFAQPEEIAALVRYLLCPEASYVTGSVIPVDGGLMASLTGRR